MKEYVRYFLFIFLLSETVFTAKAQQFLNGSFENCTAPNYEININNATFNSFFTNVKGIGANQQLDIAYDITCFLPAQNGHYYVSLESDNFNSNLVTAISLELSDSLITAHRYFFSYYDMGSIFTIPPVEIGVSDNDSTFGTLIYTSPIGDSAIWTHRTINFISPITAKYITARAQPGYAVSSWVHIDNFSFDTTSASVDAIQNENKAISAFPNPSNSNFNFRINEKDLVEKIEVRDLFGRNVLSTTKKEIDLSEFPDGVYLFQLTTKKGKVYIGKLIKQGS